MRRAALVVALMCCSCAATCGDNVQARKDKAQAEGHAAAVIAEATGAATARKLQADAEAAANEKIARSITPELVRYRQIEKWNGVLPEIQGGAGTTFLLDARSHQEDKK